uniref:PremRNAsplicing helicase BRR2 putative n=1 Tax=Albugo laibachii Nc14 TaxID=890382 RepID=F0WKU3_9STRA|nr:premRNAsplicing helicase BRR2 putative [Albugo laibachii Nc14]|eukprot:CCA21900.1 premRNAsplicing helicase BRR2 putative [Albugo laibachii Nc14]
MAEEYARSRQYAYQQNSNLVLEADRDSRRRPDEATGEVESLAGRISYRMGDRAQKATPFDESKSENARSSKRTPSESIKRTVSKKLKSETSNEWPQSKSVHSNNTAPILSESLAFQSAAYHPTNAQSREAHTILMGIVTHHLGAQPFDVLASTVEEVLSILQNEHYRDNVKAQELQKLFKSLGEDERKEMFLQSKRITDFQTRDDAGRDTSKTAQEAADQEEEKMDDDMMDKEMGVAVVFDEEDDSDDSDADEAQEDEAGDTIDHDSDHQDTNSSPQTESMNIKQSSEAKTTKSDTQNRYYLNIASIDAFWLQRKLSQYFKDPELCVTLADQVLSILRDTGGIHELSACENRLVLLLDYDKFDLIKLLLENRAKVYYCTKLKQAQSEEERRLLEEEMKRDDSIASQGIQVLNEFLTTNLASTWMQARMDVKKPTGEWLEISEEKEAHDICRDSKPRRYIDIDTLAFQEGGHLMSNKQCSLPEGTWRAQKKGYEEVHVPATRAKSTIEEMRIKIASLPSWAQNAFPNMESLNRIQSKMYDMAFKSNENLLLCAPTGAGKTNVAMLTILHEIMKVRDPESGEIDLNAFKIVYVAPMKALVQEVVLNLSSRLTNSYGIHVRELSGDQNLSREQLHQTQIIVTTPEKWDIITRKSGDDRAYMQLVRLIILDEIHLLHDSRGPVLEALVARTIRTIEMTQQMIRLVGLSATLPNYADVAAFLRVDKGLFFFDSSYRPVPLQQQYIGVMEKKAIKRFALMNRICFEKVTEQVEMENQILIFVHSRKETALTAQAIRDMFVEEDTLTKILTPNSASSEILMQEAQKVENASLKDLLPYGFGIHHAGMRRDHRTLVEELFADGHLKVLVSTSTLAWGVNLPAHTVIIKGTQVYDAERGDWKELGPLDILQMLGRAGRIQYDTQGEGIIITQHAQLTYYLSLMNQQLPVESQLLSRLAENLNAEIVLGSIQTLDQAATWLGYTYLFIRMLRNPTLYGLSVDDVRSDPTLLQYRTDLAHSAATALAKQNLIKYERRSGYLQVTALGRIASHYYVAPASMQTYNQHLKPHMSDIEILRLFSLSNEFQYVSIRAEEKLELVKLMERVPVPIKEALNVHSGGGNGHAGSAKVNVLLQAYISRLKLDGFALLADMTHIHQSAARIFRALFEICLSRGWAHGFDRMLVFCKMVERRMWCSHSPLRQFQSQENALIPESIMKRLEKKDIPWERYLDLEPSDLGQLVMSPKHGKALYQLIHQFPKLEISVHVQPITRSMLKVELIVTPDFEFRRSVHGNAEAFWVFVEDVDGENLLYAEFLLLQSRFGTQETYLSFTVPLMERMSPLYYVRVVSDKWLRCESAVPIPFQKLILPQKNPPSTELLDLQPLMMRHVIAKLVHSEEHEKTEKIVNVLVENLSREDQPDPWRFTKFNPIQTQVAPRFLEMDGNVLVCGPPGSGKLVLAELAIMRALWALKEPPNLHSVEANDAFGSHLLVYLNPVDASCDAMYENWNAKFGEKSVWQQNVLQLTGDASVDLGHLASANLLIGTPSQWDVLSRRWKQRKRIQNIVLFLVDELQFLGMGDNGPVMEVVVSRMRFISVDQKKASREPMRMIGFGTSIANARDIGEWMGVGSDAIFNFHLNVRPQPLEIRVQGFQVNDFASRMLAMSKPVYNTIIARSGRAVVFVPSIKQAQLTAIDLVTFALADNSPNRFGGVKELDTKMVEDTVLLQMLQKGVGFWSEVMTPSCRSLVLRLFEEGSISVLVIPQHMCWNLQTWSVHAHQVVIMGTQSYDGKEHRYVDYPLAQVFQMTKFANAIDQAQDEKKILSCVLLCHEIKKKFYAKFLYEPLPVESQLEHFLTDHFNAEIVTRTIESKQDGVDYLTWTFMYRRLMKNPNYYNLLGATHIHLSDHLSDLVENTVTALQESQCIEVVDEEDRLLPLNLGMIAAYYNVKYTTIELFACSLTNQSKLRGLMTILSSSSEFQQLPCRFGEEELLRRLAKHLKFAVAAPGDDYSAPAVKVAILLQMHFSKRLDELGPLLRMDLKSILQHAVRLLHAMVDVISSNGWLKPALAAMDLAQMIVQAQWNTDSPLLQIPFFTNAMLKQLQQMKLDQVETPTDILSMDEEDRTKLLPSDKPQLAAIASFCNSFPDITVRTSVIGETVVGALVKLQVHLEREVEDGICTGFVQARYYPVAKAENWWVVLGNAKENSVLSIKRVPFGNRMEEMDVFLEFNVPNQAGKVVYQLYVVCDGYLGADLENEVEICVLEEAERTDEEEGN